MGVSALVGLAGEFGGGIAGGPTVRGISEATISREKEPVAADTGINGHVLLAIRAGEGDWVPHHA